MEDEMRAYLPLWWQKRDRSRTRSPDRRERMSTPEKEPPNERDRPEKQRDTGQRSQTQHPDISRIDRTKGTKRRSTNRDSNSVGGSDGERQPENIRKYT